MLQERDEELAREQQRQEENDVMRKQFAQAANAFHGWLTETRWAVGVGAVGGGAVGGGTVGVAL